MSTPSSEVELLADGFVHPTRSPRGIPGDIVEQLCKEIFAHSTIDQYDLSLMRGPQSQWCTDLRFRKGLALVSKVWWKPATRGLYEHVVIRRFGQIPALARTLSSKDAGIDFGTLVRKITLHECVFFWPCMDVVREDLRSVLEQCVALEEFSCRSHPKCDDAYSDEHTVQPLPDFGFNPMWLFPQIIFPVLEPHGPTTLRKLDVMSVECWRKPEGTALLNLLAASPRITTLAIQNFDFPDSDLVTLEFLEELWVSFQFQHYVPVSDSSSRAIWNWELPRLRSLTILNDEDLSTMLEKHGHRLTYLHIACDVPCYGEGFDQLSRQCPVLEHFIFYPPYGLKEWAYTLFRHSIQPFRHLRYLDMWLKNKLDPTLWHHDVAADQLVRARSRFAPALEGVRGLIWRGAFPLHDDLPRICHPSSIAGPDDSRHVCVRDVWMVQTGWYVRPLGDWWFGKEMWAEDDSGDYEDEDDDEDRTSWISESDSDSAVGSDPEEGSPEEEDGQVATAELAEYNLLLRRDKEGCQSKGEQLSRGEILEGFGKGQECGIIPEQAQSQSDSDASVPSDVL